MTIKRLKDRNVFISGPMSGITHYNVAAFCDAHATLKERGVRRVYNPAIAWLTTTNPDMDLENRHETWMRLCISNLVSGVYDLLVQLPGWHESDGTRTEFEVAMACGIEVCELSDVVGTTDIG